MKADERSMADSQATVYRGSLSLLTADFNLVASFRAGSVTVVKLEYFKQNQAAFSGEG